MWNSQASELLLVSSVVVCVLVCLLLVVVLDVTVPLKSLTSCYNFVKACVFFFHNPLCQPVIRRGIF